MANFQNQNLMTSTGQLANTQQPNQQPNPPSSIEQNALSGNKQQTSNFMNALNNVGAGGNNSFMSTPSNTGFVPANLVNPAQQIDRLKTS